jgi:hypothetical protein
VIRHVLLRLWRWLPLPAGARWGLVEAAALLDSEGAADALPSQRAGLMPDGAWLFGMDPPATGLPPADKGSQA